MLFLFLYPEVIISIINVCLGLLFFLHSVHPKSHPIQQLQLSFLYRFPGKIMYKIPLSPKFNLTDLKVSSAIFIWIPQCHLILIKACSSHNHLSMKNLLFLLLQFTWRYYQFATIFILISLIRSVAWFCRFLSCFLCHLSSVFRPLSSVLQKPPKLSL